MAHKFLFADEAGCFTFARGNNISRYFILCTVVMEDDGIASSLLTLRRRLAWQGAELGDYFHASEDKQPVRDAVYQTILEHPFTVQATIMEKSKAQPQITRSKPRFYQHSWFYHFKHGIPDQLGHDTTALVTAASLGNRREKAAFREAVDDVMRQTMRVKEWRTDFPPAHADPCLQVVDYCAWALHRKWESPNQRDIRSYDLIKDRITYEYDLWERGEEHYF